ncbi:LytR/AlgR family response regulator transcription factor [Alteribacter keqinensis]|uniref:DNA-binding response regulator n=1 Tax=Alteribacter keqinensis TaxID=2483800 RepID=A0A3M7TP52_9BACI|nr:LytTR family DNA-binding domain-containing protein [Alteribacter keqinensis]RNA67034.1 DNA-binding response regulator [Alteribacter keqinensis]
MIRVVIVDDEPLSRDELAHLLSEYKDMEVVGQAGSGEEGLELSLKLSPDVIFLDIEMAEMSGVELAKALQQLKKVPAVVFATAYPDYAVNAFRLEALDYLLKPFDEEQLEETVERIRSLYKTASEMPSKKVSRLAVEHDETITYLTPEEIDYCFREGKETKVCTGERCYSSRLTLRELEEKLAAHSFFRTHKGYLVNLERVESLTPWLNGAYQVKMRGGTGDIPVSRNYVKELRQKLEL